MTVLEVQTLIAKEMDEFIKNFILKHVRDSRNRALAVDKLQEAVWWCMSEVLPTDARNEPVFVN
jgi:hypothetical protein